MSSSDQPKGLTHYRYGQPGPRKGLSIGVARHLPRGIRKEDYARRGYFDVWLPLLAPSRALVSAYHKNQITFRQLATKYRAEMRQPEPRQVIRLVATMTRYHPVHLGCFCADATRCHRTILTELVETAVKELPAPIEKSGEFFSPACAMPEIED